MSLQPVLTVAERDEIGADAMLAGSRPLQNSALDSVLGRLRPVGLDEIQDLALLRRTDTKFLIPRARLSTLLDSARAAYRVLEVKGLRIQRYETLYFDTPALDLYLLHHNRARRRFKARSRRYLESDISYLEVKLKERCDRTVKVRRRTPEPVTRLSQGSLRFLESSVGDTAITLDELGPTLWNAFSRITLLNAEYHERVTLDLNLVLSLGARSRYIDDWVVAEVKGEAANRNTPIVRQLRALGVRPTGFSKYCIGVASLYPDVKHNRFNSKLRTI